MRISSSMIQSSQKRMYESDVYNKHVKKSADEDKAEAMSSENDNEIALTENTVLVKNEDTYSIERIVDAENREVLQEVDIDSDYGKALKKYTERQDKTPVENEFTRLNTSIKTMNLSDYI